MVYASRLVLLKPFRRFRCSAPWRQPASPRIPLERGSKSPRMNGAARAEEGSILLEAALVMPVLLLFLVLLAAFVQFSAAETALQAAADRAARQTAAHIRPAMLLLQQEGSKLPESAPKDSIDAGYESTSESVRKVDSPSRPQLPDWRQAAAEAAAYLPDPAGELASAVLQGDWKALADMAAEPVGLAVFEPFLRKAAEDTPLEPSRISLASLSLPDLEGGESGFLKLEAEYEFPIRVPFLGKKIILHRTAAERVWIPDPLPSQGGAGVPDSSSTVQITELYPIPARPGRKATLEAVASPGAQVTLEVRYKSGNSVSKHVGTQMADASGHVEWTWLVSGNTTPGQWEVVVTTSDGASASMPFIVQKKG
ncbi:Putative uncharacterized protein [Paenibacillus sp. P22]|nr:Putative uncharacterized protein [Paenibacillus sp. P22]